MSILGNRVLRTEDPRLLTEGGVYVADLRDPRLDDAVYATYVRSTVAHAEIAGVEVADALASPGVIDVVTGDDVDLTPIPGMLQADMARPYLARGRVRFAGEPVAVVLSETPEAGADAADLVVVDYEPLPAVTSPLDALEGDTVLFPELGTNLVGAFGNPAPDDGGPGACEVVVRQRIVNQRLAACSLEVRSTAAAWVDGRLIMWCSTQSAHGVHTALVGAYGLDPGDVRVIAPDVGGGFGAKSGGHPEDILVPWLARRCGRPVRWVESRTENMLAMAQGRAQIQDVTIGGTRDGVIEAYHLDITQDTGAYPSLGALLPGLTRMMAAGTYTIPAVSSEARALVTNAAPVAAYRGAGRPEAAAALERAVDLFAAEVGLDPAEVRRRNLVPAFEEPYTSASGATYDCGDFPAALERVLEAAGYDELRAEQARRRAAGDHRALGIGLSVYVEVTGGPVAGSEFARLEVHEAADDGRDDVDVVVYTGSSPHGQGLATAFAMVAAEEMGLPVERIRVVHGDTDQVARGIGTFGSRSLQLGGSAVRAAAVEVVDRAREVAAELLEAAVDDVVLDPAGGRFHVAGTPAAARSWAEVAAAAGDGDGAGDAGVGLVAELDFQAPQPTFPFGAHLAVVEVDTETGDARLVRLVAVDDAGRVLNPLLAEGQRHGGLAQGAAQALYEHVQFDADGNPLTTNFADYAIVSAAELPSFELVPLETPTWVNPLGAKGIGESGTIGSTPAVQNAVCDALAHLGVRHVDMPCSPERVWQAIQAARPGHSL
ncbi:MAG TPA: xanthine dehydrogenase family protein molybdopterin-binding subunit [Acidimicrobiales bacterium]|nr:xanthine dehydrogenase family protein molybdopterin-binding subunit [Acidimicrobiales bacterium]